MQRVNSKKSQIYKDKDFEIQSLTNLVKMAKARTIESMDSGTSSSLPNVQLPLHGLAESLTESLQQMHHHLQGLLMLKLGPEARNVIAAERARQARTEQERLERSATNVEQSARTDKIPKRLADVGTIDGGDELELLNAYRERYANMLAGLAVARDALLKLEKQIERDKSGGKQVRRRVSEDLSELSGEEDEYRRKYGRRRRKRRSSGSSTSLESPVSGKPEPNMREWNNFS